MSEFDNIPTYKQVADAAGLPAKVTAEELIGVEILMEEWEPGKARIPQTGETTEGFWAVAKRLDNGDHVTFFVGQTVLVKALKALAPPFRVTIVRDGQAYEFR